MIYMIDTLQYMTRINEEQIKLANKIFNEGIQKTANQVIYIKLRV